MSEAPVIVWLRYDLRLDDQPAFYEAAKSGKPIIPLFNWAPDEEAPWQPGAASCWWLHHSLLSLQKSIQSKKNQLIIRQGKSQDVLDQLIEETGADTVYWSRRYEPALIQRDTEIKSHLKENGVTVKSFNSALLFEPWEISTQKDEPYKVFTPFWKACTAKPEPLPPLDSPKKLKPPQSFPHSLQVDDLGLLPTIHWYGGMEETWQPGEEGAVEHLKRFNKKTVMGYKENRDHPDIIGTSRLSPYLHFGEISPRRIWHAVREYQMQHNADDPKPANAYLREIGWREFAFHILYHFPHTTHQPMNGKFAGFPWKEDREALRCWQKGQTGYPIVDAGMRELWATGWMHNRVRMVVASFLVKDLLIPWQEGAKWFWDTLVDADLANNSMGWQWTAGCGADAAPYFRIFNPILQGEKFDKEANYVRHWVPELKNIPNKWIHHPWDAPGDVLAKAGVVLGKDYPHPIVDHRIAKDNALDAYQKIK